MFGFRFIKTQPTTYLLAFRGGKVVAEGAGLSLFLYSPVSDTSRWHGTLSFLAFNTGALATISVAERAAHLIQ